MSRVTCWPHTLSELMEQVSQAIHPLLVCLSKSPNKRLTEAN